MGTAWPNKGDRLFQSGGAHALRAHAIADLSVAADGFKDAADVIVRALEQGERNDTLLFPVVYCYRQHLELKLKAMTDVLLPFSGTQFRQIHDLDKLWAPLRAHMEQSFEGNEREALVALDACVKEMNIVDRDSTAFRYPQFSAMKRINHQVDLGHLRATMAKIANLLDAVESSWDASR